MIYHLACTLGDDFSARRLAAGTLILLVPACSLQPAYSLPGAKTAKLLLLLPQYLLAARLTKRRKFEWRRCTLACC
jgi:hypothetical protein